MTWVLRLRALTFGFFACKLWLTDCYKVSEFGYISMNPRLNEAVRPYGEDSRSQNRERGESPAADAAQAGLGIRQPVAVQQHKEKAGQPVAGFAFGRHLRPREIPAAQDQPVRLFLHDLGKVGVPDAVLRKTRVLDEGEWESIREHPEKGAEVLSHLAAYQEVAAIVRYHHERLDGSGYPHGITGDSIPELSKVLAIADSYHAMTSDRPYRRARSSFEALKELRTLAGTALDAGYVEVLAKVLRDKDLAYRDGSSTDFMGEYERGRINLRLRGHALADVSGLASSRREDPAAG